MPWRAVTNARTAVVNMPSDDRHTEDARCRCVTSSSWRPGTSLQQQASHPDRNHEAERHAAGANDQALDDALTPEMCARSAERDRESPSGAADAPLGRP